MALGVSLNSIKVLPRFPLTVLTLGFGGAFLRQLTNRLVTALRSGSVPPFLFLTLNFLRLGNELFPRTFIFQ